MNKKYYVTMTDKFMTGRGRTRGKTCKYVVECDTLQQAEQIEKLAEKRYEMECVNLHLKKPYYMPSRYDVSLMHYSELGDLWTVGEYKSAESPDRNFFVAMTNTLQPTHRHAIECDTLQQVGQIVKVAYENPDIGGFTFHNRRPQFDPEYSVTEIHYNELGDL